MEWKGGKELRMGDWSEKKGTLALGDTMGDG